MSGVRSFLAGPVVQGASLASSYTSPAFSVSQFDNLAIQLNFTGTPTGTFTVQAALDYDPNASSLPGTWVTVSLNGTTLSAAGAASQILIEYPYVCVPYLRVVYTASSGTGALDIWVSGKAAG